MPRYFLDLPEDRFPLSWDPSEGPRPERRDTRYWAGVFHEMERTLHDSGIDIYLTFDPHRLPAYGSDVVAVVLGDEAGHVPRYVGRVRAVFKCYGTRPLLASKPLRSPSLTGLTEIGQYIVRWLRWLPGGAANCGLLINRTVRGQRPPPRVSVIPLGTFNQLELPLIPIEERRNDVFFAGSVQHGGGARQRYLSPKNRARREMIVALERLAASRSNVRFDIRVTPDFQASEAASSASYSLGMMDARVCLAPRGTSVETYRLLEGLRYGCVVVSDRLPRHWFYAGAPFHQLDRWDQLETALLPLLDDPGTLRRAHADALEWWNQRCSEEAVGRFLADRLNELSAPSTISEHPSHRPARRS